MIPFSPPRIDDKIVESVSQALRSGWITTGPRTKQFEKDITAYCGAKSTVCLNSATLSLELALRWFGVQEGDEVIVPAYTYCATANVVVHCGAKVIMVDANPHDFNMNMDKIREVITPKTKAIMPVDLAGFPCDYDALIDIVNDPQVKSMFDPRTDEQRKLGRILLLADSSHAFGATYKGRTQGSIADISVFSFHAVKNLVAAEGGSIVMNLPDDFDHEAIYKYLCIKSLHGQSKDALSKTKPGGWKYDVIEAGFKCNMTDIQAAIGLVEIARYKDDTLQRRRHIRALYDQGLKDEHWAQLPPADNDEKMSSHHLYLLRIKDATEDQRNAIIEHMFENQVSVNVHFIPLPLLTVYKNMGYRMEEYPVAYDNYSREITLPLYYDLSDENVGRVIEVLKEGVKKILG